MTANDKFSFRNGENLQQPIQLLLSKKQNIFSEFLIPFVKSTSNLEHW